MATKKTERAQEILAPFMESKIIVCNSPEELQAEVNSLLQHFDLYDIKNETVPCNGKLQFVAYVYGKERAPEP